jgi:hypothetical protein
MRFSLHFVVLCLGLLICSASTLAQSTGAFFSPGELSTPHAELEGITNCTQCHELGGVSDSLCLDCHDGVRAQLQSGEGFHALQSQSCTNCHPDHRGRDFEMIRFDAEAFKHQATGFPLTGNHGGLECVECHTDEESFLGLDKQCGSCHEDEEPHGLGHTERELLAGCETCHEVVTDWKALPLPAGALDHTDRSQVDYTLQGAHGQVGCEECHADWQFVPVAADECTDCHEDPHYTSFESGCAECHEIVEDWVVEQFNHQQTSFELLGQHQRVACADCHPAKITARLDHDNCEDCHKDIHQAQFEPRVCEDCHTPHTADFALRTYDHDTTDYPLEGKHTEVSCEDCHKDGHAAVYVDLPAESCTDCHEDEHQGSFEPKPCSECHTVASWVVDQFDHGLTDFALEGKHLEAECSDCHETGSWDGVAHQTCLDCHEDDNPHDGSLDAASCTSCHSPADWGEIDFAHSDETQFDLGLAHAKTACTDCHQSTEQFEELETTCTSCHEDDRPRLHYEGDCASCHEGAQWTPAGFGDLGHSVTGFTLHGAHTQAPCESCHAQSVSLTTAAGECVACHASADPHRHMLGDVCSDCHTEVDWYRTRWRHHQTGWPLRGGHRLASCSDCHTTGYAGTPRDCIRCHQGQASPAVPAHRSAFASECSSCHHPFGWSALRLKAAPR